MIGNPARTTPAKIIEAHAKMNGLIQSLETSIDAR
jgi:hypothetical protein